MKSKIAYKILRILECLEFEDIKKIRADEFNQKFINSLTESLSPEDRMRLMHEFSCDCPDCLKVEVRGDVKSLE